MKKWRWTLALLAAGAVAGAGGMAALQPHAGPPPAAPAPEPLPPPVPAPEAPPPPSPSVPAFQLFGFGVRTAKEAAEVPVSPPDPCVRYLPIPGKCVAGFDATSTLHDFRGWTQAVQGDIHLDPARPEDSATAVLRVDARTLDTGDKGRDAEMHRHHLESSAYPEFVFTLSQFRRADPARPDGPFRMSGTLDIHGKRVSVEATGTFGLRPDGCLHAKGEVAVRMSQFGITPPSTAVVIRVGDEIKIWFEVWARPERSTR